MSSRVEMLRDGLHEVVRGLDPGCLTGRDARLVAQTFAELERLAGAGKTLAARRVQQTGAWAREGDRSFEAWLARISGTGLGEAMATAETAARLDDLTATEEGHCEMGDPPECRSTRSPRPPRRTPKPSTPSCTWPRRAR